MSRNRRKRPGDLTSAGARHRQLERLYAKYEGVCQICMKFCPRDEASRDHVLELCLGGTSDDSNMVLAHQKCNENKSKEVSRKLNKNNNPRLPNSAEELPESWWRDVIIKQIYGAVIRQREGLSATGKIPPRLNKDTNFYSSLIR